jgi:hypothetical protein
MMWRRQLPGNAILAIDEVLGKWTECNSNYLQAASQKVYRQRPTTGK